MTNTARRSRTWSLSGTGLHAKISRHLLQSLHQQVELPRDVLFKVLIGLNREVMKAIVKLQCQSSFGSVVP